VTNLSAHFISIFEKTERSSEFQMEVEVLNKLQDVLPPAEAVIFGQSDSDKEVEKPKDSERSSGSDSKPDLGSKTDPGPSPDSKPDSGRRSDSGSEPSLNPESKPDPGARPGDTGSKSKSGSDQAGSDFGLKPPDTPLGAKPDSGDKPDSGGKSDTGGNPLPASENSAVHRSSKC
jgi:hypothetical protein